MGTKVLLAILCIVMVFTMCSTESVYAKSENPEHKGLGHKIKSAVVHVAAIPVFILALPGLVWLAHRYPLEF